MAAAAVVSNEWISKWRADLAFAADSLPRAHPNFFHAISRERYRSELDSLSARVPRLSHEEIVVELARIVAEVGDGHTRVTLPFDPGAGFFTGHSKTAEPKIPGLSFRHYPIRLGWLADTLWVIRADSAHRELLGGRVVTLGGHPSAEVVTAIEPTIQRDNDSQVRDLLPTWLVCPEILHARGMVADPERAAILVEGVGGRRLSASLAPVTPGTTVRWLEARDVRTLPLRDRFPERSHWFTRVAGTRTFYARYREVLDDSNETVFAFADSLFAAMDRARADRLVLDARGNVGGNGFLNRPLVQHIVRSERLWHPGALWVLIDRGTFSAAVMLAADLELRTPAVFVGEKTGGHPNSYGDSRRVVLPNTGVTVRVSSLFWQLTGPQDARDGITPLVPMVERFADWRADRDPALAVALADGHGTDFAGVWRGEVGYEAQRLAIRLELARSGATWSGHADLPDAELEHGELASPHLVGEELVTRWTAGGEPWDFRGRLVGERCVGLIRTHGLDFPVVLERATPERGKR